MELVKKDELDIEILEQQEEDKNNKQINQNQVRNEHEDGNIEVLNEDVSIINLDNDDDDNQSQIASDNNIDNQDESIFDEDDVDYDIDEFNLDQAINSITAVNAIQL